MARVNVDLHEAMVLAMVRSKSFSMPALELADIINKDKLFVRKDRQPLPTAQVVARARRKAYKDLFRVSGPKGAKTVSLRRKKATAVEVEAE